MADIYETITNKVIEQLEKCEGDINPFAQFSNKGKYNYKTKKEYSLLNSLCLPKQGAYITFKQALEMGGKPKKGCKTHPVFFFTIIKKTKEDGTEDELPILKYFNVFHMDDIEGIVQECLDNANIEPNGEFDEIEDVINGYIERSNVGVKYVDATNTAHYNKNEDAVSISTPDHFQDGESYYHVLFHELAHSTGTIDRLHRKEIMNGAIFGDVDYSREELTAELASCMIMSHFGINHQRNIKMTAGYVKSWIQALKNDKRMIVFASSRAEKACKYILTGEEPQY